MRCCESHGQHVEPGCDRCRIALLENEVERLRAELAFVAALWNRYCIVRAEFNADYKNGRYWFNDEQLDVEWGEDFSGQFVKLMDEALQAGR